MRKDIALPRLTILLLIAGCRSPELPKPTAPGDASRPAAVEATRKIAVPDAVVARKNPFAGNTSVLADGRRHYERHCAICHGLDGRAHTEIGEHLFPEASDLLDPVVRGYSDGMLYYLIENGVHQSGMPAWKDVMRSDEIWKVATYIRDLQQHRRPPAPYAGAHGHEGPAGAPHERDQNEEGHPH